MNISPIIVKANAGYKCQECGSGELVQSHHQIPGDDSTQICLCASCHIDKHPDMPRALFFADNHQPYWFNKSAAQIAREVGVCSRTIIRIAKKLDISKGELSVTDEALLVAQLNITKRQTTEVKKEAYRKARIDRQALRDAEKPLSYCPRCRSKLKMVKGGLAYNCDGSQKQRWLCRNKRCGKVTVNPLKKPKGSKR